MNQVKSTEWHPDPEDRTVSALRSEIWAPPLYGISPPMLEFGAQIFSAAPIA